MGGGTGRPLAGGARTLGTSGRVISRMGYGAMELAGAPRARAIEESEVVRFLNEVIDRGVAYIDTSIDYGWSEKLIGTALAHRRGQFFLASKCACEIGIEGPREGHEKHVYTGENVRAGVEQSLRRMKTDHLDLVQVHGDPTRKELEEGGVIEALQRMQQEGKLRHLGISSRLPRLAEFIEVDYFSIVQLPYSALQRQNEGAIAALHAAGKAVVARGITGRGAPGKGWATRPIGTTPGEAHSLWQRAGLDEILGDLTPIEFMIRFALANEAIDVVLVATTDSVHLAADIAYAAKGPLDAATLQAARDRLVAAGGGAGQGSYAKGGPSPVL